MFKDLLEEFISLVSGFAAILVFSPLFVFPGLVIGALGGWIGRVYTSAQLSVKREMSNAKSPVYSHFGAAMAGLTSIRAFGAEEAFTLESRKRIDHYTRPARVFWNLNR